MNCKKTRHAIIAGEITPETAEHITACAACRELQEKVEMTMSLLDRKVTVPDTLAAAILSAKEDTLPRATRPIGLATFLQVAAAVCFGIFIGHQVGNYAGPANRTTSTDPLQQYFKAHHFNLDHADFRSSTFITKKTHE